jgi:hypothetical protein
MKRLYHVGIGKLYEHEKFMLGTSIADAKRRFYFEGLTPVERIFISKKLIRASVSRHLTAKEKAYLVVRK